MHICTDDVDITWPRTLLSMYGKSFLHPCICTYARLVCMMIHNITKSVYIKFARFLSTGWIRLRVSNPRMTVREWQGVTMSEELSHVPQWAPGTGSTYYYIEYWVDVQYGIVPVQVCDLCDRKKRIGSSGSQCSRSHRFSWNSTAKWRACIP